MQTFKRYAMSSLVVLIVICACGKAENHITEAADSILPRQTEEAKELVAQPVEVKDISLNKDVILKVAVGSKGCCIRKITAKKSCKKLVIPGNIEGVPVTSIEHTSNSTAAPDDDEDDDGLSINIFGVMNNNSDCDGAASTEELMHANNTNIQEIVLPDSVKTIAKSSFQGLTGLKKIHLPKQLKEIEDYTFARCSKLKRIDVPQNVSKIDIGAFWLCKSFKRLHIKSGNQFFLEKGDVILNKSDYSMFMFSKKKKNAVIPKEVRTVGRNAFNFFEPKTIKVSKKNKYIKQKQNCIYEKKSKTLVAVKSDKNNVVNIPKGIRTLGSEICCIGFVDKIIIPKSVKYWCEYWYYNMYNDSSRSRRCIIYIKGKKTPTIIGDGEKAIPWDYAYKFKKNYFKLFYKSFKKNGRKLRWSKVFKAYVCE